MNNDVKAYLVSYTVTLDDYKQEGIEETLNPIFGTKDGIKRAEFYAAGNAGLRAEFVLTTAQIDYNGEKELELDGERYAIYRTYPVGQDYVELYCEHKVGVQEPESDNNAD